MNRNYLRSRRREQQLKNELEAQGWFCVRAAGSKGVADLVCLRPAPTHCADPDHYEVRFIQVKVSQNLKQKSVSYKTEATPCGLVNVEYLKFPVRVMKPMKERR